MPLLAVAMETKTTTMRWPKSLQSRYKRAAVNQRPTTSANALAISVLENWIAKKEASKCAS